MRVYLSGIKGFVSKTGKHYVVLSISDPEFQNYVKPEDSRVFAFGRENGESKFLPETLYGKIELLSKSVGKIIDLRIEKDFKGKETISDIEVIED